MFLLYTKNKYDHLNRLLEANYSKPGSSQLDNYLEKLEYDKNGNITKLERNGGMDALAGFTNLIDKLDFSYDTNKKIY